MRRLSLILAGVLFWLPACGGGGGGGTPAATLPITTQIAQSVAELVLGGGGELDGLEGALDFLGDELNFEESGTFPCPIDGTYTTDIGSSSGSVTFNDCEIDFGDGVMTINGSIEYREINANTVGFRLDLTVFDGMETFSVRGDMRVEFQDAGGGALKTILTGDSLTFTSNGQSFSLQRYRFEETVDLFTGDYTLTERGTISTGALGGTVNFRTTTPLSGSLPDDPISGVIEIDGALGSVIIITVNGLDVRVDTDEDGDGQIDDSFTTTWDDLAY